ncbi:hypothetical protein BCV69DRAFT_175880 [Microstroma glucosiphilum]|uniref:Uncharacterized protein n=1 Tax=Pseudomicrostroma glucosiphilum TaxID=1684307 RepID=A0A316UB39_9BASI|nr:hypothetical protein BCV69DRAFT_175880 [Pseudomicrostroma glucosiphilum]PWN21613.1 hypothetical protein BCV69DRAFT_175880 [Pseudomicrostroma glucosiphilum]
MPPTMESERQWLASVPVFPLSSDELAGDAFSYGVGKSPGGEKIRAPYLHPFASSSSSRLSGKRSRSNSPLSFSDSPPSDDGGSSQWSSSSSQSSTQATSTPPSPPSSSQESDSERGCPSPTAAKRKAIRCRRHETACAASARRQGVEGATVPPPQPSSSSSSASSSFPQSDAELSSLDNAVQAFGLDSHENTPERPVLSQIDQPPSTVSGPNSINGCSSAAEGGVGRADVIKEAMVDHLVGEYLQ